MTNSTERESSEDSAGEFLTFILGSEEYGVDILSVQGIQGWDGVTRVPDTPEYMLGVINLRGAILPIIDLRVKFKLEKAEFNSTTVVIVVRALLEEKEHVVGIVVDAVSEVYKFEKDKIQINPEFNEQEETEAVKGLISIDEKMVIILDIDQLIAEWLPEMSTISEAA